MACATASGSSASSASRWASIQPRKTAIRHQGVLDHLGESGTQLARRQRGERVRVGDDGARLVEGADQVLAAGMVDPGLAAHGRIDLGEQRGRELHVVHAALVAGGRETCHVADDAAAEGRYAGVAVHALLDERVEHPREGVERLVALAVRQDDVLNPPARESVPHPLEVQRRHRVVRDHQHVACIDGFVEHRRRAEQARSDQDRVAALAELDAEPLHQPPLTGASRHGYLLDHRADAASVRVHDQVGGILVEGCALLHEALERCTRVVTVQQGPRSVAPRALELLPHGSTKIHDAAAAAQPVARVSVEDRAPARGHDHALAAGQQVEHLALPDPEAGLALALEDVGNVHARARLDLGVAVHELEAEPLGELPAHGALARAHGPDQEDVVGVQHAR